MLQYDPNYEDVKMGKVKMITNLSNNHRIAIINDLIL